MEHGLHDLARHNAWATAQLLACCQGLDEPTLATTVPGTLERFLTGDWDSERLGEARGDEGEVFAVRTGVFLTQALHHANEHRAHICTILGALGHEPPDVSAWGYALATGRMTLKTMPIDA